MNNTATGDVTGSFSFVITQALNSLTEGGDTFDREFRASGIIEQNEESWGFTVGTNNQDYSNLATWPSSGALAVDLAIEDDSTFLTALGFTSFDDISDSEDTTIPGDDPLEIAVYEEGGDQRAVYSVSSVRLAPRNVFEVFYDPEDTGRISSLRWNFRDGILEASAVVDPETIWPTSGFIRHDPSNESDFIEALGLDSFASSDVSNTQLTISWNQGRVVYDITRLDVEGSDVTLTFSNGGSMSGLAPFSFVNIDFTFSPIRAPSLLFPITNRQTHPTPVSYTHLTLPTILRV